MVSNRAAKIPHEMTDEGTSLILFEWKIIHSKQVWRRVKKCRGGRYCFAGTPYPLPFLPSLPFNRHQSYLDFVHVFLMLLGTPFLPLPRSEFCAFAALSVTKAGFVWGGGGEVRMGRIRGVRIVLSSKMQPISGVSTILLLTVPIDKSLQVWLNQI